ncbi:hypothetical protein [Sphingomonas sp. VNH70]|uniref:hypothetical protein n=1 Tax=Sphingomonas silueang TaxID=3156617 RepID=UPI0032B524E7
MIVVAEEPAFRAAIDPVDRRLEFTLVGHWDIATVTRFEDAIRACVLRLPALGIRPGEQVALFDTGRFSVQSADVLAELGRIAADPRVTSRRIALVLASALLRMQAKRAMPQIALFGDRAEAVAWLAQTEAAPA